MSLAQFCSTQGMLLLTRRLFSLHYLFGVVAKGSYWLSPGFPTVELGLHKGSRLEEARTAQIPPHQPLSWRTLLKAWRKHCKVSWAKPQHQSFLSQGAVSSSQQPLKDCLHLFPKQSEKQQEENSRCSSLAQEAEPRLLHHLMLYPQTQTSLQCQGWF